MPISKEEQAMRDKRNARCLFYDRCHRNPSLLRKYVEAKTTYDSLVRADQMPERAREIVTSELGLPEGLTFTSYQVDLAQRILDGKFPGILPPQTRGNSVQPQNRPVENRPLETYVQGRLL